MSFNLCPRPRREWRGPFSRTSCFSFWPPVSPMAAATRTTDTAGTWAWTSRPARPGCAGCRSKWSRPRPSWTTRWTGCDGRQCAWTGRRAFSNSRPTRPGLVASVAWWDWAASWPGTGWAGRPAEWGRCRTGTATMRCGAVWTSTCLGRLRRRSRRNVCVCGRRANAWVGCRPAVWPAATRCSACHHRRRRTCRRPCGSGRRTGRSAWTRARRRRVERTAAVATVCATAAPVLPSATSTRTTVRPTRRPRWRRQSARRGAPWRPRWRLRRWPRPSQSPRGGGRPYTVFSASLCPSISRLRIVCKKKTRAFKKKSTREDRVRLHSGRLHDN